MTKIFDETVRDGVTVRRITLDLDADTYTREEDGQVVETRVMTDDERARFNPPPPSDAERLDTVEPLVLPPAEGTLERTRYDAMRQAAMDAMGDLQQILDAGSLTNLNQVLNGLKVLARNQKRLIRLQQRRLDAED